MNRNYGSLEIFLTYTPTDNAELKLTTNILGRPSFDIGKSAQAAISLQLGLHTNGGGQYAFQVTASYGDVACDSSDFSSYLDNMSTVRFRVVFYNERVSVYANDKWVYSYIYQDVKYQTIPPTLDVSALYGPVTIDELRRVELSDGREAVYADYESNTTSLISSLIQQRPVEVYMAIGRTADYTYDAELDAINSGKVYSYEEAIQDNSNMSSDGIVYYADVGVSISQDTAAQVGLITKMYRLSELDTGAEAATAAYQKKALQQRTTVTIRGRLDPRIQPGDVYHIDLIVVPTGYHVSKVVIVEDISIAMNDGSYQMTVTGRKKE